MKKLLICAAAFSALAMTSAVAAPVGAPWNWTGFYVGGNVGYSWGRSDTTQTLSGGAVAFSASDKFGMNGFLGGVQLGYNWQLNNRWLVGLEADFQWTGQDGNTTATCLAAACPSGFTLSTNNSLALSEKLKWLGTVRGRVGALVTPTWLVYGTGGLAYGRVGWEANLTGSSGFAAASTAFSGSQTKTGWTLGLGVEGVISGQWTGKIEYLYVDLGTISGGPVSTAPILIGGVAGTYGFSSRITDNILRVGLNYKFN